MSHCTTETVALPPAVEPPSITCIRIVCHEQQLSTHCVCASGQDWQGHPHSPTGHPRPPRITPPPPPGPTPLAEPSHTLPPASSSGFFCDLPSQATSSSSFTLDPDCMPIPMSLSSPDLRYIPHNQPRPLAFSGLSNTRSETLPEVPSLSQDLSARPSTSFAASAGSADLELWPPVMQSTTPVLRQPNVSRRGRACQLALTHEGSFDWRESGAVPRFPDLAAECSVDAAQAPLAESSSNDR